MDKKKKSAGSSCEYCMNYEYDEDYEYYVCTQDLDQDEMYRFITCLLYTSPSPRD